MTPCSNSPSWHKCQPPFRDFLACSDWTETSTHTHLSTIASYLDCSLLLYLSFTYLGSLHLTCRGPEIFMHQTLQLYIHNAPSTMHRISSIILISTSTVAVMYIPVTLALEQTTLFIFSVLLTDIHTREIWTVVLLLVYKWSAHNWEHVYTSPA